MENSSNGKVEETREVQSQDKYKEVVVEDVGESKLEVESVKIVEIDDDDDSESIFEKIVDSAEKVLDGDDSSSSPQVEEDSGKDDSRQFVGEEIEGSSLAAVEEKALPSLVENDGIPPVVEGLVSKGVEVITCVVSGESEETGLPIPDHKNEATNSALTEEVHSKGIDENPGESSEAAYKATNENVQSPEIPENRTNPVSAFA